MVYEVVCSQCFQFFIVITDILLSISESILLKTFNSLLLLRFLENVPEPKRFMLLSILYCYYLLSSVGSRAITIIHFQFFIVITIFEAKILNVLPGGKPFNSLLLLPKKWGLHYHALVRSFQFFIVITPFMSRRLNSSSISSLVLSILYCYY